MRGICGRGGGPRFWPWAGPFPHSGPLLEAPRFPPRPQTQSCPLPFPPWLQLRAWNPSAGQDVGRLRRRPRPHRGRHALPSAPRGGPCVSGPARHQACSGWLPSALGGLRPEAGVGAPGPPLPTVHTGARVPVVSSKLPPPAHTFLPRLTFSCKSPGVPRVRPQPSARIPGAHAPAAPLARPSPRQAAARARSSWGQMGVTSLRAPPHVLCRAERDEPSRQPPPPPPAFPGPLHALEFVNVFGKRWARAARVQVRPAPGQRAHGRFSGALAAALGRGGRGLGAPGAAAGSRAGGLHRPGS